VANLALPFLFLLIRQIVIVFSPTIRTLSFMGFCVFVASGLNFDVDSYLKSSPFKAGLYFEKAIYLQRTTRSANQDQIPVSSFWSARRKGRVYPHRSRRR